MILKEKETWIFGTALFIGFCAGTIINNSINFKPDIYMRLLLGIILYLSSVGLVAIIKWGDRLLVKSLNLE